MTTNMNSQNKKVNPNFVPPASEVKKPYYTECKYFNRCNDSEIETLQKNLYILRDKIEKLENEIRRLNNKIADCC